MASTNQFSQVYLGYQSSQNSIFRSGLTLGSKFGTKTVEAKKSLPELSPQKVLKKYVQDLENQDVQKLSKLMDNKKYYHNFSTISRPQLMEKAKDGTITFENQSFDLILNQRQFEQAISKG